MAHKLHHIEIHPGKDGGHKVIHHHERSMGRDGKASSGFSYGPMQEVEHYFGKGEDHEMMAHIEKTLDIDPPQKYAKGMHEQNTGAAGKNKKAPHASEDMEDGGKLDY